MRCMRRVFASMVSRNRSRSSGDRSGSRSVSAKPPMTVSGVLSSCDTLATKSRRIVSSRRRVVRSMTANTAPPSGSGRAVMSSVRSPSASSVGSVAMPSIAPRTASRTSRSCGSRSTENGTVAGERQQAPRALVQPHDLGARAHGDDALVERLDDRVEQRVFRLERRESRRELLGHAMEREREIADFARRRERRPTIELAGGDRARDVAQLDDRLRHAARERESEDQRADERDQTGAEHVAARAADDLDETVVGRHRHAREAERVSHGDVDLVVAGRRARSRRRADALRRAPRSPRGASSDSAAVRRSSPSNSESPTTTPVESISVTRRPSAAPGGVRRASRR